jgi:hypothetical protein
MLTTIGRDLKIRGYTVGQSPNPPLWTALAALLVGYLTGGTVHNLARGVFYVALTVWAYEEAARGVNRFRRALGAIALVLIAVAIARAVD